MFDAPENSGYVQVCATVGVGSIQNPFTLVLYFVAGESTAALGEDFQPGVVIPAGSPLSQFNPPPSPLAAPIVHSPVGPNVTFTEVLINFTPGGAGPDVPFCSIVTIFDDLIFEDRENILLRVDGATPYSVDIAGTLEANISILTDPEGEWLGGPSTPCCVLLSYLIFRL